MRKIPALAVLLFSIEVSAEPVTGIQFSSGVERVPLIELYTSEGCSSCPPADRWLSELHHDPDLWTAFTPVGFHVDYWDYLGWRDRFAKAEYSQRQRQIAAGASVVYTPGMFRDGREWRAWRRNADSRISNPPDVGRLNALVDGEKIMVSFMPVAAVAGPLIAQVAVLGMNLSTEVRAGENRGKTLRHDFVVLALTRATLRPGDQSLQATLRLPDTSNVAGDRALAVWVSAPGEPAPLQSTGGFLPASVQATSVRAGSR